MTLQKNDKSFSICVITEGYPYEQDSQFSFVGQLCEELSRQGITVTVISPQSFLHIWMRKAKKHPLYRKETHGGLPIYVYRPYLLLAPSKFWRFNDASYKYIVSRQFKKIKNRFSLLYAHFWNNAYYISDISQKNKLPLFVASGEGNFDDLKEKYLSKKYQTFSKKVKGVICVSSYCEEISIEYNLISKDKCIVLPNSIDNKLFYQKNKKSLRIKYGINENDFIIVFVGAFIKRKGSNRLSDAIDLLANEGLNVKSFFIGKGQGSNNLMPLCKGILHCGPVEHSKIPDYLNMADVFVLPTLNEGCSNAIIEAMACGLPIISSDLPFNYDVLDETNSIMINPNNIGEIANAIKRLYFDKKLRESLSRGAIETSKELNISERAKKIIKFINSKIEYDSKQN